jgi:hypothetical protein
MTAEYPINIGKIVLHEPTGTRGQVVSTHFPNGERTLISEIEQEVKLHDGSVRRFKFTELRLVPANEAAPAGDGSAQPKPKRGGVPSFHDVGRAFREGIDER